ncbi:unnamed protein product [Adineta ricciae]|uniref:Uncharacterized protein n=1 Tax=Adineta ricciae TaxID=249248 RepID=A0A815MH50_ADIRI|nr:unnamed protein product [Adineta ricciae]CAF1418214.1 unnamed protein product [Adineta ricciae]
MDKTTYVCDRGNNLVKALEDHEFVHCFPHRLNKVVKRAFYSAGTAEKNEKKKKGSTKKNQNNDQFSQISFITDDEDPLMDYDD